MNGLSSSMLTHSAIALPGYHITAQLYAGSHALVYQAVRDADQQPVVIKFLKNEHPSFSELVQFRNQYTVAKNLSFPGIIQSYSLEPYRNSYALVMEDGGISLQKYVRQWGSNGDTASPRYSLPIPDFLAIALQLCDILHELGQNRVIHKDIKPANILINPDSKVKLIDFSIASLLPRETHEIINPNVLEGTLAYLSPEQTGRMNRGIDYRSDFYSLGVTFYELLTGQLPFSSNDPMELVHCHISRHPTFIHSLNPQVPPILSEIVAKLMAKNAEDRYQSALGLKHDLELCSTQWQEGIPWFPLGQRDISDRFVISERLYGREAEVGELLSAFNCVSNGNTELLLVAGFSGIGKTAVINEVHKPIVRQRGYFIKGKFDQFGRIPLSAFVQALRDLMGQLLSESDAQLEAWKSQILSAVGENGQVIVEVIPELEQIIGTQPPVPELSGSAAQNRFNLLFQKFIGVFATANHPLVVFIDDLQWADSASLNLIKLLMSAAGYLLLLGAYRDNEVFPAHPLILALEQIKTKATLNTITLAALSPADINQLVADTLSCAVELAHPLGELVYQKTQGNPFFTTQFLKALHDDGLITFDLNVGHWQCDIAGVRSLALTDDVVEFMALQLQKLPVKTQNVLKLAACIGAQFDLQTLAIVSEHSPETTAADLWRALQEGLLLPTSDIYKFYQTDDSKVKTQSKLKTQNCSYRFLHDRVQQAAYSLIPDDQKQVTHLRIGRLLLTVLKTQDEKIFEIVNQLNQGAALLTDAIERDRLAQLNLTAGQKAKAGTAYAASMQYAVEGIKLLAADCWQQNYELTLTLYEMAAEAASLNGDFVQMEHFIERVLHHAQRLLDKIKVYQIKIHGLKAQNQFKQALEFGVSVLQTLGVELPVQPSQADVSRALADTQLALANLSIEELINLPPMQDASRLGATRILFNLCPAAYSVCPELMVLIVCKQIELALQYGNAPAHTHAYAMYGLILCCHMSEIEFGYQVGQLALSLVERLNAKEYTASTLFVASYFTLTWKIQATQMLAELQRAYAIALEAGDVEHAAYAIQRYSYASYYSGAYSLVELKQTMASYGAAINQLKQPSILELHNIHHQVVLNLLGEAENPCCLVGEVYDEEQAQLSYVNTGNAIGAAYLYLSKLILFYLFEQPQQAVRMATQAEQYLDAAVSPLITPAFHFYDSLAQLASYADASELEQERILIRSAANQEKMQKWASHAPMNYLHKFHLLEAERCRVLGHKAEAIDLYDRAIAGAKANEYIQEASLANELAAKFYLNWGKERIAQEYLIEAYYGYAHWGAKAKVADLETRYPQLLAPILQQSRSALSVYETVFASETVTINPSSVSDALDLAAILKASQTLSKEIELGKLLSTLLQLVIENAGADKCVLLLMQDERLLVKGLVSVGVEPVIMQQIPVEESQDIPHKLIYRVKNRLEPVVLLDATAHTEFVTDPYFLRQQPKSILCSPIWHQGKLLGLVYLENKLTFGAFTNERVNTLNLLCAQAAISLENARLYQRSQDYAQELEQSLFKLRASEARFQRLADNLPGMIYQIRIAPEGSISTPYISSGCAALYEVPPADFLMGIRDLRALEHPDDRPSVTQAIVHSAQTIGPFEHEWRIVTPSGKVKWIQAASRPEQQTDGSLVWDGVMLDISDRKQTEQQLQESQQLLQLVLNTIPYKVFWKDPNLAYQGCNASFADVAGVDSPTEIVGKTDYDLAWTAEESDLFRECDRRVMESNAPELGIIEPQLQADGTAAWVETSKLPLHDANGSVVGILGIYQNITERKQAEAASKEFQERLAFLIQQAPLGIIEWNLEFKVVGWNSAAEKIFGYEAEAMLEQHATQIVPESDRPHVAEVMQALLAQRGGYYSLNQNIRQNGTLITCEWINTSLLNAEGQVIGIFSIVQDVSDRIAAELAIGQKTEALEQALQELQQAQLQIIQSEKMSALGNLVAGIAHEINNPVGFIKGNLQPALGYIRDIFELLDLYQQEYPNPSAAIQDKMEAIDLQYIREDLPKLINSMTLGVQRIRDISTGLRTFSRADRDYKVPFNIHDGIDSTILILKHRLKANGNRPAIEVVKEYGNLPPVECFPGQLNQVFMNILANAIDALEEGMRHKDSSFSPTIHTRTDISDSQQVTIQISDNGMGMSEDIRQRIFDHLFTTKAVGQGTGLGLAIAQQIVVEKHGGKIEVNSTLGKGTEFLITLPVKANG